MLDQISPNETDIENFLRESHALGTKIKKRELTEPVNKYGVNEIKHLKTNRDGLFRAQKAVVKLRNENRPDLAAHALALDSSREERRSILVPMAPSY